MAMSTVRHKKTVQQYYSKRAIEYDKQKARTWKSERGFEASIINFIIAALANLKNKLLLEVGVGSGRIGFPLLEKVNPWLVGLDLSREMLKVAKAKMSVYKQEFDLVLGDAEHLPFIKGGFDAVVCISTMHYFMNLKRSLTEISGTLKEKGTFVYGDLTLHEMDSNCFLDKLEKTISKAHAKYYKPSKMKSLLENYGFSISKMKVFHYRKSYGALIEDKGKYFGVKPKTLEKCVREASPSERKLYFMSKEQLTLFYTLITALKRNKQ